jgi:hypothetical protein
MFRNFARPDSPRRRYHHTPPTIAITRQNQQRCQPRPRSCAPGSLPVDVGDGDGFGHLLALGARAHARRRQARLIAHRRALRHWLARTVATVSLQYSALPRPPAPVTALSANVLSPIGHRIDRYPCTSGPLMLSAPPLNHRLVAHERAVQHRDRAVGDEEAAATTAWRC